jgi:hypothetical protein
MSPNPTPYSSYSSIALLNLQLLHLYSHCQLVEPIEESAEQQQQQQHPTPQSHPIIPSILGLVEHPQLY